MNEGNRPPVRVLLVCTGLGVIERGIETFFRSAFDGLKTIPGLSLRLAKGAGTAKTDEPVIYNLRRTGSLAYALGVLAARNGYVIEQWTSLISVIRQIRKFRPQVVFYSDANLGFLLFWLRRGIGVPYTLLFSNGGPVHPPFIRTDHVHQVAPCYYEEALRAGEPAAKHHFVPYGIDMIAAPSALSIEAHRSVRQKLGLPLDRKIILSVGWVRRLHKRMDYVIEEVARLPWPRPFLQILGAMDEGSAEIIALGERLLGKNGFDARSVSHSKLFEYYQAADCFVLASIGEGFGRVYLEALMHGLPVIAHRNPVTQFVLGPHGILDDLAVPGVLEGLLNAELSKQPELNVARSRWQTVRDRFSWPVLAPGYRSMFHACAVESGYVEPSVAGTHFATW